MVLRAVYCNYLYLYFTPSSQAGGALMLLLMGESPFTARPMLKRGASCWPVSVRLSVSLVYYIQMAKDVIKLFFSAG